MDEFTFFFFSYVVVGSMGSSMLSYIALLEQIRSYSYNNGDAYPRSYGYNCDIPVSFSYCQQPYRNLFNGNPFKEVTAADMIAISAVSSTLTLISTSIPTLLYLFHSRSCRETGPASVPQLILYLGFFVPFAMAANAILGSKVYASSSTTVRFDNLFGAYGLIFYISVYVPLHLLLSCFEDRLRTIGDNFKRTPAQKALWFIGTLTALIATATACAISGSRNSEEPRKALDALRDGVDALRADYTRGLARIQNLSKQNSSLYDSLQKQMQEQHCAQEKYPGYRQGVEAICSMTERFSNPYQALKKLGFEFVGKNDTSEIIRRGAYDDLKIINHMEGTWLQESSLPPTVSPNVVFDCQNHTMQFSLASGSKLLSQTNPVYLGGGLSQQEKNFSSFLNIAQKLQSASSSISFLINKSAGNYSLLASAVWQLISSRCSMTQQYIDYNLLATLNNSISSQLIAIKRLAANILTEKESFSVVNQSAVTYLDRESAAINRYDEVVIYYALLGILLSLGIVLVSGVSYYLSGLFCDHKQADPDNSQTEAAPQVQVVEETPHIQSGSAHHAAQPAIFFPANRASAIFGSNREPFSP